MNLISYNEFLSIGRTRSIPLISHSIHTRTHTHKLTSRPGKLVKFRARHWSPSSLTFPTRPGVVSASAVQQASTVLSDRPIVGVQFHSYSRECCVGVVQRQKSRQLLIRFFSTSTNTSLKNVFWRLDSPNLIRTSRVSSSTISSIPRIAFLCSTTRR